MTDAILGVAKALVGRRSATHGRSASSSRWRRPRRAKSAMPSTDKAFTNGEDEECFRAVLDRFAPLIRKRRVAIRRFR